MTTTVNYKQWRHLLPGTLDELAELRARALRAVDGEKANVIVSGFVGWAWEEMNGDAPAASRGSNTEAAYRKLLRDLAALGPLDGPPLEQRTRRRRRGDAGRGLLPRSRRGALKAAIGFGVCAAGAATGNVVLMGIGPVILDQPVMSTKLAA